MTQATHTPGPWGCADTSYHAHDYRLSRPNGEHLPVNAPYNDHSEQRANARLIAAAPDLLAALEAVLAAWDEPYYGDLDMARDTMFDAIEPARAAIAKAKGE